MANRFREPSTSDPAVRAVWEAQVAAAARARDAQETLHAVERALRRNRATLDFAQARADYAEARETLFGAQQAYRRLVSAATLRRHMFDPKRETSDPA